MQQRLRFTGGGTARRWLALWLLPLVWMSIAANVPHDHDLHDLAASKSPASTWGVLHPSTWDGAAHAEHECPLCEWASVATAWLQIVLALSLSSAFIALFFFPLHRALSSAARLSNSRAPPAC